MSQLTPYPLFSAEWLEYWQQQFFSFADGALCNQTPREFLNKLQVGAQRDANIDWASYGTEAEALAAGFASHRDAEVYAADRLAIYANNAITAFTAKCNPNSLPGGPVTSSSQAASYLDAPPDLTNPAAQVPTPAPRQVGGVSLVSPNVSTVVDPLAAVAGNYPNTTVPSAMGAEVVRMGCCNGGNTTVPPGSTTPPAVVVNATVPATTMAGNAAGVSTPVTESSVVVPFLDRTVMLAGQAVPLWLILLVVAGVLYQVSRKGKRS